RDLIEFDTEVQHLELDEQRQIWKLHLRRGDGSTYVHEANAVVSAVGQLNRPKFPDIPGQDRFAGDWFHSARWNWDVELEGRRVGVIGTGASAAQFIPAVAEQAGELKVFQRTPPWLAPTPNYHDE